MMMIILKETRHTALITQYLLYIRNEGRRCATCHPVSELHQHTLLDSQVLYLSVIDFLISVHIFPRLNQFLTCPKWLNKVPLKERTLAISVLLFLSGVDTISYKKGSHKSDTPCGILGSCGFGWYGRDGDMRIGDKKLADIAK